VPSRAADHLFWLGRYTERLEQLLRVLRCIVGRISGEPGGEDPADHARLTDFAVKLNLFPANAGGDVPAGELSERMLGLIYDPGRAGGVRDLLGRIRFLAVTVRDRFSGDMWRILGRLELDGRSRVGRLPLASATALIHKLVLDLAAFDGMEMENMTRGYGWLFLDFGRRLERGLCVLKLLSAAAAVETRSTALLEAVLEIADSAMTYRRRHFAAPRWAGVLELLLRDQTNPRSVLFQIAALREHARVMAADLKTAGLQAKPERIDSVAAAIRSVNLNDLSAQLGQGMARPLLDRLNAWAADLAALSDEVSRRYFSHSVPRVS
jgi:uncharacterized alpha-E superfamily protein